MMQLSNASSILAEKWPSLSFLFSPMTLLCSLFMNMSVFSWIGHHLRNLPNNAISVLLLTTVCLWQHINNAWSFTCLWSDC